MTDSSDVQSAIQQPPDTWLQSFRFIGPSIILTATLVGSGELIVTTTYGAQVGFQALWLIIATCFLKVAIQEAIGRYTISSGDTTLVALNKLPGPRWRMGWPVWIWLIAVLLGAIQLGGISIVVGECLQLITQAFLPQTFLPRVWAPIVCLVCLIILFKGRYQVVERVSTTLVSLFSISIILSAIMIQWTEYAVTWSQLASGFSFQLPRAEDVKEAGAGMALAIVAAVGLSPTEIVYYPYWCVEKGYARFTGSNDGTPQWQERARGWIRVMQLDCFVAMLIYTSTTVAFYLLGAAILYHRGEVPEGMDVVATLSSMYTETFGPGGYWVFIISSLMVLFSTLFVSIASYSRLLPDCFQLLGAISIDDDAARRRWIRRFLFFTTLLFAIASQLNAPPVLLIVTGLIPLGVMLPMVCWAAVYLRYRHLDQRISPPLFIDFWLWASVLLTAILTLYACGKPLLRILF